MIDIGPVRPMYKDMEPDPKKRMERLQIGTKYSGVIVDVTRNGLEITGYYTGRNVTTKYLNLREPVCIPWDELTKMKERIDKPAPKNKIQPDYTDDDINQSYLDSLPVVTINSQQYYIDPVKKERRSVKNPKEVFKY
jgi:hypothetical protein